LLELSLSISQAFTLSLSVILNQGSSGNLIYRWEAQGIGYYWEALGSPLLKIGLKGAYNKGSIKSL